MKNSKKRSKLESTESSDPKDSTDSTAQGSNKSIKKPSKQLPDLVGNDSPLRNSTDIQDETTDEAHRSSEAPKSKKKVKTVPAALTSMPEPNPETVSELDPNLIGELTPRLSRKRFKELSSTPTATDTSREVLSLNRLQPPAILKSTKKKSKTRTSSEEPVLENQTLMLLLRTKPNQKQ